MKILFVTSNLQAGGAERVISIIANCWAEKKYHITLLTLDSVKKDFYPLNGNIQRIKKEASESIVGRLPIIKTFTLIYWLWKKIREIKPDIVISFLRQINSRVTVVSKLAYVPVVIAERTDPNANPSRGFQKILETLSYPYADILVVQSNHQHRMLNNINKNIYVIPNPVRKPARKYVIDPEKVKASVNKIISVGRLVPQKQFDILLKVFSVLLQKYPNLKLEIIGEGPEDQNLNNLAKEANIRHNFTLIGQVQQIDMKLSQADLFVFTTKYEGFPNVLVEAMAIGLPVVSFEYSSAVHEIITNGIDGILVPPGDVNRLIIEIDYLIKDLQKRVFLSKNAQKVVERFNTEKIISMWDEIIKNIIGKK